MNELKVTLLQSELIWENPVANRAMFEEKISLIEFETDVIVLPEMFSTGFTMNTDLAEVEGTHTYRWMRQMAKIKKCAVVGSFIVKKGKNYFNHLLWVDEMGNEQTYDKKHLFRMANEHNHFSPGSNRIIIEYRGWKILPLICYDLRFPEWSRNRYNKRFESLDYDLLLYLANWPAVRSDAWNKLLYARAIENLSYCAGVNRIGKDGNGVDYTGDSRIIDFKGEDIASTIEKEFICATLKKDGLTRYRDKFPAFLDADF